MGRWLIERQGIMSERVDETDRSGLVPPYLVGVCVAVALVLFCLLVLVLYLCCCSRRHRLNWFERTILDAHRNDEEKRKCISIQPSSQASTPRSLALIPAYNTVSNGTKYAAVGVQIVIDTPMGSNPSTPMSDHESSQVGLDREQFWVPPALVEKKRAQSLVPHLGLLQTERFAEDYGSPSRTPTSSTSLQEMTFDYPSEHSEKLAEAVSLVQLPSSHQRRRRASMQDALDHTKINARLYDRPPPLVKQQSVGSIQEENKGSINFSLHYHQEQSLLTVRIIQARDLAPRDDGGPPDPYCRLCLLPTKKSQLQSRIHKKTFCPEFEEEFIFDVTPNELAHHTVELLLYNYDQFSRDECIGQVYLSLDQIDLSEKVIMWKGISKYKRQEEQKDMGDLMFSIGYLSAAERLRVVIMKARNLGGSEDSKHLSPFVRVYIMCDGKRLKKKKTSTKRNCQNPVWNESLLFNVAKDAMHRLSVELLVYHDNLIGNNETLGKVVIGPNTSDEELAHWNDVLHAKNAMARWHHLIDEAS